ncbi:hypothetical protein PENTCL1PPCAC_4809, partial [Pristionchus entomophagus]
MHSELRDRFKWWDIDEILNCFDRSDAPFSVIDQAKEAMRLLMRLLAMDYAQYLKIGHKASVNLEERFKRAGRAMHKIQLDVPLRDPPSRTNCFSSYCSSLST